MLLMQITSVTCCGCEQHAWVSLGDPTGEWFARFTIDLAMGQAILAELRGLRSPEAGAVDGEWAAPADGARPLSLTLRCEDDGLTATMSFASRHGPTTAPVDPCQGLLAACRMRLPILMAERDAGLVRRTPVPPVYHALLDALDLD